MLVNTFPDLSIKYNTTYIPHLKGISFGTHADWNIPRLRSLPLENTKLFGYFRSHRYFEDVKDELRSEFTSSAEVRQNVYEYFRSIKPLDWEENSYIRVGIHVRRTDLIGKRVENQGNVQHPIIYFLHAMDYFNELHNKFQFIIASDDIAWCKKKLNGSRVQFSGKDYVTDLAMLSMCDNTVCSTGTYGWWAGWLCNGTTVYY